MPRLMVFAACEKVIVGREDNSGSRISILQGFNVPADAPVGDKDVSAMMPLNWYVFVLWEAPNHTPGQHVQRIQLFSPDGTQLFSAEVPIVDEGDVTKRFHRAALRRSGFVYRGTGDYMLRLSVRDTKSGQGFVEVPDSAFPIPVGVGK
jgi:hypothetical protein